jgi:hypothetical protein
MTKTEEPTIALPELEEPFCCSKVSGFNSGQDLPVVTSWEIISDQKWVINPGPGWDIG